MMVGAFTSPGEEEVAEPLFSPGESLHLAGDAPVLGRDRAEFALDYRETPLQCG